MPIPIDEFLGSVQVALANVTANNTIKTALADFGYTDDRMAQGQALYNTALTAQHQQKAEYADQISATDALNQTWETAHASYMRLVKVARVALKDNAGALTRLGLNGKRKRSLSGWLLQAQQFYTNLLNAPDLVEAMKQFGMTPAKLKAAQAEALAVEAANQAQEKEKGEAQNSTKTRDAALDALNDWFSDFVAIARVALEESPQLLESLGIWEPS